MERMMHEADRGMRACRRRVAGVVFLAACCLAATLPLRAAPAGDEAAFMELWQRHLNAGSNPVEFVRSSAAFEKQHAGSLLIPAARGLVCRPRAPGFGVRRSRPDGQGREPDAPRAR